MERIQIGGIMQNAHLSLLNVTAVPDRPGIAAAILSGLGDRDINVQFIVQCIDQNQQDQVAFCVDRDDHAVALELVTAIAPELEAGKVVSLAGGGYCLHLWSRFPRAAGHRGHDVQSFGGPRGEYPGHQYFHLDCLKRHHV